MTRDKQHGAVGASGETVSANSSRTIIIHVVIVTVVLITAVTIIKSSHSAGRRLLSAHEAAGEKGQMVTLIGQLQLDHTLRGHTVYLGGLYSFVSLN